eukprot:4695430-Pyramimonas_sp.AAC.1
MRGPFARQRFFAPPANLRPLGLVAAVRRSARPMPCAVRRLPPAANLRGTGCCSAAFCAPPALRSAAFAPCCQPAPHLAQLLQRG